ncbi:MAG: hypothetical protein ACKVZJ_10365 [Phycisphaerales bacterium]
MTAIIGFGGPVVVGDSAEPAGDRRGTQAVPDPDAFGRAWVSGLSGTPRVDEPRVDDSVGQDQSTSSGVQGGPASSSDRALSGQHRSSNGATKDADNAPHEASGERAGNVALPEAFSSFDTTPHMRAGGPWRTLDSATGPTAKGLGGSFTQRSTGGAGSAVRFLLARPIAPRRWT